MRYLLPVLIFSTIVISSIFSQEFDSTELTRNYSKTEKMSANDIHHYTIELDKDQFILALVEQLGIDVIVKVYDPENILLEEIDAPTGDVGFEYISFTSRKNGKYRFEVHPFNENEKTGKYRIKIERCEDEASDIPGKIDQMFAVWDNITNPGAAVAVAKDGEIVFKKGYGSANLEYDIPVSPKTVFHIASVSKQFTAFVITSLADEGKLSLDDDIRKYIPELPDFGKTITIRHLIHHTSGLRDQWNLLVMAGWRMDDVITKEHIFKLLEKQKELNFDPGAEYLYCNSGYTILGEIVSRVTGKSLREWTNENIFEPLGMNSTLFFDDHEEIVKNRAYSYGVGLYGEIKKNVLSYANVGATSLFTTVEDLCLWAMNFENPKIGNENIFKQMEEKGTLNNGDKIDYAFGQGVGKHHGLKFIGHGGADAGFRSYLGRFPDQKLSVVILSNLSSFNTYYYAMKIAELYLADQMTFDSKEESVETRENEDEEISVDLDLLNEYAGEYELEPGTIIKIFLEGDKLIGHATGQIPVRLYAKSDVKFFIKEINDYLVFGRDESGLVSQLTVNMAGQIKRAKKIAPYVFTAEMMEELTGDYYSDEITTTYSIGIIDSSLVVRHRKHDDFTLNNVSKDVFETTAWFFGTVKFERDENQNISGMRVSNGRIRNLKFEKQ